MTIANPEWLSGAADRERWRDTEWGQWEQLRSQFHDMGVEALTPAGEEVDSISAHGQELVVLSEDLRHHEERPVLAALHRLAERVSAHLGHGT